MTNLCFLDRYGTNDFHPLRSNVYWGGKQAFTPRSVMHRDGHVVTQGFERGCQSRQFGRMSRIKNPAGFLVVDAKPACQFGRRKSPVCQNGMKRRFERNRGIRRHLKLIASDRRRRRNRFTINNSRRQGLGQAVGRFLEGHVLRRTVGQGFRQIGKPNKVPSVLAAGQRGGIGVENGLHRGPLLQVGLREAKLSQHRIEQARADLLPEILYGRLARPVIDCPVAALASAFVEPDGDALGLAELLESPDELGASHEASYRTKMPLTQAKDRERERPDAVSADSAPPFSAVVAGVV